MVGKERELAPARIASPSKSQVYNARIVLMKDLVELAWVYALNFNVLCSLSVSI
jgi:hypothetical protein